MYAIMNFSAGRYGFGAEKRFAATPVSHAA